MKKLTKTILVSSFALAAAAICGCRGSDVVIYDGDADKIVWGSIGTDSTWREAFASTIFPGCCDGSGSWKGIYKSLLRVS